MSDKTERRTEPARHPRAQQRPLDHRRPPRPDPDAGPLHVREDAELQPGAGPGAGRSRQGRRRARILRGDRGRHASGAGPTSSARSASETKTFLRFSTVAGEQGSPDTWRDPRGFALKFYTEHGNYDLVGNNTPVFFVRDPIKFSDFIHSQKRDPGSGLRDETLMWDFWSLTPESLHQVVWLMGDRGIPRVLPPHERVLVPHLSVDQRRRRGLLGQVPLQGRPGHRVLHPGRGRRDGRSRPRLPPPRPVPGDRVAATTRAGR